MGYLKSIEIKEQKNKLLNLLKKNPKALFTKLAHKELSEVLTMNIVDQENVFKNEKIIFDINFKNDAYTDFFNKRLNLWTDFYNNDKDKFIETLNPVLEFLVNDSFISDDFILNEKKH